MKDTNCPNMEKKQKRKDSGSQFEFCKACKLNHNQGRKHIYFPNHKKALSAFLSRFKSKLSDVQFVLKNPTRLHPNLASENRIWCVFCDLDILETHTEFSCGNAIRHLASNDHLKEVKALLWRYGAGMDRVDAYCIAETDLAKWERKCLSLKTVETVIAEEGPHPPLIGPINDIHSELYLNSNGITKIDYDSCNISNHVLPLQKSTNEKPQVSSQVVGNIKGIGSESHKMHLGKDCQTGKCASGSGQFSNGNVYSGDRFSSSESSSHGYSGLTRITPMALQNTKGNVHSGAPPPWFSGDENNRLENLKPGQSEVIEPKKPSKLNPKRVGAAWAERRKIELEQERLVGADPNNVDSNWLPNFGGVWHSSSRKESRKQFEVKRKRLHDGEVQPERALQLQPYVSKRMRPDAKQ